MKLCLKRAAALLAVFALLLPLVSCGKLPQPINTTAPASTELTQTAPVTEAPDTTEATQTTQIPETTAAKPTGITESCDYFSVIIPESWEGRYVCEKGEKELYFYHEEAQEEPVGSALLFSLTLWEQPKTVDEVGPLGDASYEVCKLRTPDANYYIMRYDNVPEMFPDPYDAELTEMLSALDDFDARLAPKGSAKLEFFNYSGIEKTYADYKKDTNDYELRLFDAARNILQAELTVRPRTGGDEIVAAGTLRMFNGGGFLYLDLPDGTFLSATVYQRAHAMLLEFNSAPGYFDAGTYEFRDT